jgi:hypothetical protein
MTGKQASNGTEFNGEGSHAGLYNGRGPESRFGCGADNCKYFGRKELEGRNWTMRWWTCQSR